MKRPNFLEAWLDDLLDDVRRYGPSKLIPWAMVVALCIGITSAWLVATDEKFWKPEISMVFFTASATVNGLLLALSWGSFAKIYELASKQEMAAFLRRHGLIKSVTLHVDFIHVCQISALSWSCVALLLCAIDRLPETLSNIVALLILRKITFAGTVSSTFYALYYAVGAVKIMQDLFWYSAHEIPTERDQTLVVKEGGRGRRPD